MIHRFSRTELLIGNAGLEKLSRCSVAIFGIGGVGSFAAEALARAGLGSLTLVDGDAICLTNINRQLHAASSTIGRPKAEVMRERILDINPDARVTALSEFYLPKNAEDFFATSYDYMVDAIDMVTSKIDLIVRATARDIPMISSMGAGNKLDPSRFEIADLYATSVCPLARVMRRELRSRGVGALKVVYSKEAPLVPTGSTEKTDGRRQTPGSISFVPSVAGLLIAAEVVKDLLQTP